jgi:hypothetical protein
MRKTTNFKRFQTGGAVLADTPPVPPVAIIDVDRNDNDGDDASLAFQKQIEALKESERIQQQRAAQAAQVDQIIRQNPSMLKHPDLVTRAEREALQSGHAPPYSSAFHDEVRNIFEEHLNQRLNPSPAPEFFEPLPEASSRGAMVSAPVSRDSIPSSNYGERRSGSVRLSPQQKEAAAFAGVSEADYARGILELEERKRSGHYER